MGAALDVVVHEASRTGAPRVLLELLGYTREHSPLTFAVRSIVAGPLDADFEAIATHGEPDPAAPLVVNGIGALDHIELRNANQKLLLYTHEVGIALERLSDDAMALLTRPHTTVLCVSETAERQLSELGVRSAHLHVLPPAVTDRGSPTADSITTAREHMGAPSGQLVVGCGEAVWRKAPDLFLEIARHCRTESDAAFSWVGRLTAATARKLFHDRASLDLDEHVTFTGEVADALPYLAAADVLLVCSRNDPQPLVMIEAALVNTPTAGWDLEGMADLAAAGGAAVSTYPDTRALGSTVADLLGNAERRDALASAGRDRFESRQRLDVVGNTFISHLDDLLANPATD